MRWPRILGLGVFLVAYGTNVSTPLLISYKERLSIGDNATMAIFVVYVVGILGVLPFGGQLSDRYGRRTVAVPFVLLAGLASLMLLFGRDSFALLLLGRFFLGASAGVVLSVGAAWMQELLGPRLEQRSAVLSTVLTYGGFGFGPLSALLFETDRAPLIVPFAVHAAATLLVLPFLLRVPETAGKSTNPIRLQLGIPPNGRRFFRRVVAPAALWVFGFPSASFALFPVIISDSVEGSKIAVAAASATVTSWAGLAARPLLPRLGAQRSLNVGMALGTLGYVFGSLAYGAGVWQLLLPAAAGLGGASGLLTGGSLELLGRMANEASRGSTMSTFYLLAYPGMAMPLIITGMAVFIGLTSALITVTAVSALSMLWVVTGSRREEFINH
jgi:hypothetical protein